jgi:hypothetical protein
MLFCNEGDELGFSGKFEREILPDHPFLTT